MNRERRTNMSEFFATCTYCQEEINGVRVQCCECPDFDICLQCFSVGAEIGTHRNNHAYKLVDHCATSVFGGRGTWTGKEQMQLLDAVELYGFGNWELVSEHVETRSPEEVKEEYIARYLEGNIGKAIWAQFANRRPVLIDHVPEDNGPLSPTTTSKLPPVSVSPEEARILGYKPHRDDFDGEYDMEAESLVSELTLDPEEDTDMDVALKLAIVDMYERRLRERARRKRLVREYQLIQRYFNDLRNEGKPTVNDPHKELYDKMKVFAQYLPANEHERLVASIERERELRYRLSELMRYRGLGLTTQEEIIHYEQHAAFERQQELKHKSGSSGYAIQESQLKNGKSETDRDLTEKKHTWLIDDDQENCYASNNSSDKKKIEPVPLKKFPMGNILSENELQLCSNLKIQPAYYTTLKSVIIQENLLSPGKLKNAGNDPDNPESSVKEAVMQYLAYSGWLPGVSVV